ncbi:MAG: Flp family type IVb pilin [Methylocystis sp.]|uniref:Flp family type IVb pilin n=1 Tax=Methylocystis sp. TaxID=1911079 RepID=UPI003DA2B811
MPSPGCLPPKGKVDLSQRGACAGFNVTLTILELNSQHQLNPSGKRAKLMQRFLDDRSGATAIEYALIASLIGLVIIVASTKLGTTVSATFEKVSGNL